MLINAHERQNTNYMFQCFIALIVLSNLFFTLSVLGHSLDRGEYVLFMSMHFRESDATALDDLTESKQDTLQDSESGRGRGHRRRIRGRGRGRGRERGQGRGRFVQVNPFGASFHGMQFVPRLPYGYCFPYLETGFCPYPECPFRHQQMLYSPPNVNLQYNHPPLSFQYLPEEQYHQLQETPAI